MRQSLAGLLWSKQFYHYVVGDWLEGDQAQPPPPREGRGGRNADWPHLYNADVFSMPDKWGDDFRVEFPTGSGNRIALDEVAAELSRRLSAIFLKDENGERPVFCHYPKLQDPHFRDWLLFYEYFHGEDGSGVGANHQTGWTGLVAKMLQQSGE